MRMMDAKRKFLNFADMAAYAAKPILKEKGRIKLVSHYDADGICAAAIMYSMLKYHNKNFEISFVKMLGKDELDEISSENNSMVIFTDIGSGQLKSIREHIGDATVVIADHHQPEECSAEKNKIYHLNPHIAGINGEDEISGAGVAYILARSMSNRAKRMVDLAIVGAASDRQCHDGEFRGVNRLLLEDAECMGLIKSEKGLKIFGRYTRPIHKAIEYLNDPFIPNVSGNESGAVQFLSELGIPMSDSKGKWRKLADLSKEEEKKLATILVLETISVGGSANDIIGTIYRLKNDYDVFEFSSILNACGRLSRPFDGLNICIGASLNVEEIVSEYRRRIAYAFAWAKRNKDRERFIVTKKATYVMAKESIDENIIGTVITMMLKNDAKTRVIFGFGNGIHGVKVSARAKKNEDTKGVNLGMTIKKIVEKLGGEALGGGHAYAAGAMIPKGSEMKFVEIAEEIL